MASKISVSLSRIDRRRFRQEPGDRDSVQLDCVVANDAQLGHVGRPTGFCGTLITVPSRSSTKQWKIVLSAVGARYPHSPTYGAASAAMPWRRAARDEADAALFEAMKAAPSATPPRKLMHGLPRPLKAPVDPLNGYGIGGCGRLRQ